MSARRSVAKLAGTDRRASSGGTTPSSRSAFKRDVNAQNAGLADSGAGIL
jgi:hypothetical protein